MLSSLSTIAVHCDKRPPHWRRKDEAVALMALETTEEPQQAAIPERHGRALLRWVAQHEVRPLFYGSAVTSPESVEEFVAAWTSARSGAKATGSAAVAAEQHFTELPPALADQAAALSDTEQFRTQYQPFGATFATAKLSELITPQWWVDLDYVDELAANLPAKHDIVGLFRFSFSEGYLAPPMLMGANAAAFASKRRELGSLSPLRIARHSPTRITLEADVTPRPNWIWLAAVQGISRPLILNGVHHLLALQKAGRNEAFVLMRHTVSLDELRMMGMSFQDPAIFNPDQIMSAEPPLLRHYLDKSLAQPVSQRALEQYMRVILQPDLGFIPRGA